MTIEPPPPPLSDPLSHIRALAQFPNTFKVPSVPNDVDSIHHAVKSRGAKNPEKVLEEAKKIVDGGSELLNSNYEAFRASMGIEEASLGKENEKQQERRPGLGRRRPKFTIKRTVSQPPESLLTNFDGSKFPDPEEFFDEFLKHEKAQKEIKRLMGISDEEIPPQKPLKRGPGILGNNRKPVTYKHRYAEAISKANKTLLPSPERMELTVPKPPNNSRQGNNDFEVELQANDPAGSITKTEHEVNMLLDELLLSNSEDLDGHGAVSLLQERLDIKPIELSTLSIPNFKPTEKIDHAGKNLPKPRRSSIAVENFKQRTPVSEKQLERNANSSLEFSTPRNLLGSLSELRKRVMQSNPLGDIFSALDTDLMVPRTSQPDEGSKPTEQNNGLGEMSAGGSLAGMSTEKSLRRQSSHIDDPQNISDCSFLVHDDGNDMDGNMDKNAGNNNLMDSPPNANEDVEDALNLPMSSVEGLERTENDTTISPIDNHEPSQMEENVDYAPNLCKRTDDYTTISPIDNHEPTQMEENVEDAQNLLMSSVEVLERTENDISISPIDSHKPSQRDDNVKDMPPAIFCAQVDISSKESMIHDSLEVDQILFEEPHADAAKECTSEMLPTAQVSVSEQETKLPSKDQEHKRRTAVGKFERKSLSKRKSILVGGTTFESGVRRSKRIKMRPLEYWRGERGLYERVNDSIKLTGFQYISPSKDNGMLKVKSFV